MGVVSYKCPSCGSPLLFGSETQSWVCSSCGNKYESETLEQYSEMEREGAEFDDSAWEEKTGSFEEGEMSDIVVYSCPSCGAEIIGDKNTAATRCVYCGNVAIISQKLSGALKPNYVIPFKKNKEEAMSEYKKLCRKKKLLPNCFLEQNHVKEITGMYVPFWLYDCDAWATLTCDATRSFSRRRGDYLVTTTSHFLVKRAGGIVFDKVPVDGSAKLDNQLMESIEPYNYNEMVEFSPTYLSGFFADKYDVDSKTSITRANERIKQSIENMLRRTIQGYATVSTRNVGAKLAKGDINYALLPVWLLVTEYKNERYIFAMNGQTGKTVGNLPVDKGKYWAWFAGLAAAAWAMAYLASVAFLA